jgi:hypothetical protein
MIFQQQWSTILDIVTESFGAPNVALLLVVW